MIRRSSFHSYSDGSPSLLSAHDEARARFDANRDLIWAFGIIVLLAVAALVVVKNVGEASYVDSGKAARDAISYGCADGEAESAQCRTCRSQLGVCCDLRCKSASGGHDVRLRCQPEQGCTMAPDVEIQVVQDPGMPSSQAGTFR